MRISNGYSIDYYGVGGAMRGMCEFALIFGGLMLTRIFARPTIKNFEKWGKRRRLLPGSIRAECAFAFLVHLSTV